VKLKDIALRNIRPVSKPKKLSDGGGLHLLVQQMAASCGGWRIDLRADRRLLP
jgi:hypothetical protein